LLKVTLAWVVNQYITLFKRVLAFHSIYLFTMPGSLELIGNVLLFALVFGMSATVDIKCMKQQIQNKNAILLGLFCQFILLPFLGFVMVNLLQLDAAIGMTLLVVTSSPGGSYSNWCVKLPCASHRSLVASKSVPYYRSLFCQVVFAVQCRPCPQCHNDSYIYYSFHYRPPSESLDLRKHFI
jgi:ACR3 family arsenite efflux pump ArsB